MWPILLSCGKHNSWGLLGPQYIWHPQVLRLGNLLTPRSDDSSSLLVPGARSSSGLPSPFLKAINRFVSKRAMKPNSLFGSYKKGPAKAMDKRSMGPHPPHPGSSPSPLPPSLSRVLAGWGPLGLYGLHPPLQADGRIK